MVSGWVSMWISKYKWVDGGQVDGWWVGAWVDGGMWMRQWMDGQWMGGRCMVCGRVGGRVHRRQVVGQMGEKAGEKTQMSFSFSPSFQESRLDLVPVNP